MLIYPNQSTEVFSVSHPVFKFIEDKFWEWFEWNSENNKDLEQMYFGEEAIYTMKGAIIQAIESAIEEADETGQPVDLNNFDIEASFQ